jgi:hypothetical protein
MDKLAQSKRETGRGFFNNLREKINAPGAFVDGIFKPELNRVMESLKALDDRVRSELTGKQIGKAEEPAIKQSAKDLLKLSRTAFNRREWMSGVSDLAMFHKKIQAIVNDIDKFFVDVNKIHHRFLFEGVDDEKINRLRQHMEPKGASLIADQLIKEAGIIDSLFNFFTSRGRGLAAWEKKYPKETKALREGGLKLLDQAETVLANAISTMKDMATARATRRPDEYMDSANKIKSDFNKFDGAFKSYYQTAVTPWMRIKDEMDKELTKNQTTGTPATTGPAPGKSELGHESEPAPAPPGGPAAPAAPPANLPPMGRFVTVGPSSFVQPSPAAPPSDNAPDTERTPQVRIAPTVDTGDPKIRVQTHERFYQSLESMSAEDPRILCSYIAKYATSIQGDDPETAIALFSIVKKLKG